VFFFEKKNQKTFASWRTLAEVSATANKSFLLLFFKKEVLSYCFTFLARYGSNDPPLVPEAPGSRSSSAFLVSMAASRVSMSPFIMYRAIGLRKKAVLF
jgi:hypothetical protein